MIFHYKGSSMNPTLVQGDLLEVIPCEYQKIRCGDMIVLYPPGNGHYVVHRVVRANAKGVRTRGDNNRRIDAWVLGPEHIMGRVILVRREKRKIVVCGGVRGRIMAFALRGAKLIKLLLYKKIRPFYGRLTELRAYKGLLSRWIKPKVVCFQRAGSLELHLLLRGRIIGKYFQRNKLWHIRWPFTFFVDKKALGDKISCY